MRAFTFTTHIARPPGIVWAFMTDLANSSKWRPFVARMETVDGKPLAAGSQVRVVMDVMGKRRERVSRTTAFDAPCYWRLESASNEIEGSFEYRVDPESDGSRVTFACDLTTTSFTRRLYLPILAWSERRTRADQLPKLKRLLEGAAD